MGSAEYRIRHSTRARHLQIKVSPYKGVEVVVPPRCSQARVEAFIAANRDWIHAARERLRLELPETAQSSLPQILRLPAAALELPVRYQATAARPGARQRSGSEWLEVHCAQPEHADAAGHLRRWLARKARAVLVPQLEILGERFGLGYRRVHIRGQRTRWGSCSSHGTISLNYKLLFLEPDIVRYLLVHELCHTRHLNHSARYWNLVARCEPDYERLDSALSAAWREVPAWVELA